jgi:7-carboxy-7-deazaguanine synthase
MVKDNKILVSEIFQSIDGEGYHAGYPTVFFRTIGCNLRCSWYDSVYTFNPDKNSKWYSVDEALEKVKSYGINHVTITGGEPLLEENKGWMTSFIEKLLLCGFEIDIETNGAVDLLYWKEWFKGNDVIFIMDWKAPVSKMNRFMIEKNLSYLDTFDIVKIVVTDSDFEEVERVLKIGTEAEIYISPVFGQVTMSKIPEFVLEHKENKNIRCQIQMHKIFWNPDKRGV